MSEFTEEELAGLSDEERQAILEDEEGDGSAGKAIEEEGSESEGKPDAVDTPGEAAGEDDPASPADPPEGEKAEPPETEAKPAMPLKPFVPTYQVDSDQLEGIQTKLAEIDQRLEDGDIDIVEYTRQRDPLIRQQTEIELAHKFNAQQAEQLWKHEQGLFFAQNQEYRTDPVLNGALRSVFKQLDTEENSGKSGYEILLEAKQLVEARIGAASTKKEDPKPDPTPRPRTPAREAAQLPKTLADTIPAEENPAGQDEFAHLDKLEGLDYERALSKLTPDQERRYLGGA